MTIKKFNEWIKESVEFEKKDKGDNDKYIIVTLVKRENVDCANISKEDFIKFILEDLHTAIDEYHKMGDDKYGIFFDFKPERHATQSINNVCILNKNTDEKQLASCYDIIHDNKYFIKATGWKFQYEANKDRPGYPPFRPYVDVILDEHTKAERTREEEELTRDIMKFYANSRYCGD